MKDQSLPFLHSFSYDCDEFTKSFYRLNFGMQDFEPIDVKQRVPKPPEHVREILIQ
jgi:hypothetical protein